MRRDVADGSEAPLSMRVSAILGGRGQCEELSIAGEDGPYLGYAVRVPIDENGHWLQHYWNTARPEPAALDGVVEGSMVTFQTHDTSRARRTRAVLEPVAPDRLRRTMFLTEDGGEHWRVFWVDEARRR